MTDPHRLDRFLQAQAGTVDAALAELRAGRKTSHWMWFVLPQLAGLGTSPMAVRYGIASLAEARAYLAHPVLGARLRACVDAVNAHAGRAAARDILGDVDARKFQSCVTLFDAAGGEPTRFRAALDHFYGGQADAATLARLAAAGGGVS